MNLIIGLGNKGLKYLKTRHNAGHIFVDYFIKNVNNLRFKAIKTDCFMNDSGSFVTRIVDKNNILLENLYIVHDDLDLKIGEYKIQFGKGPRQHNGLNDIYQSLKSKSFWHIRIGVDARKPEQREDGIEYVLKDFSNDELQVINSVNEKICKKLATL